MNEELKKYFATKMVALGFIALVLLGNFWLIKAFVKEGYFNQSLYNVFFLTSIWTVFWMIPMSIKYIQIKFKDSKKDQVVEN